MLHIKRLLFVLLAVPVLLCSCHGRKPEVTSVEASIAFDDSVYNYGRLPLAGGKVPHTFVFYNTGAQPLVVYKVETSCHCTTSDYPKAPIPSGGSGEITVVFDPQDAHAGQFSKTISVYTNTLEGLNRLRIEGVVE